MGALAGIYVIRCMPTGQVYVGSSVDIQNRLADHRRLLSAGRHPSPLLQGASDRHGAGAFAFEVVEHVECGLGRAGRGDLARREAAWAQRLSAWAWERGFNQIKVGLHGTAASLPARSRVEALLPLTPAVFQILLALAGGERHGYSIMREIASRTEGKTRVGPRDTVPVDQANAGGGSDRRD